jgi:hypothetical protein
MVVQAAEILARREVGLRGIDDVVPAGRRRLGPGDDEVALRGADGRTWLVRVRTAPAPDPRLLTCHGAESRPPAYDLVSLTEG